MGIIMKKKSYIKFLYLGILLTILIFMDQVSKVVASSALKGKEKQIIIKNLLSFEYLENRGAAWGFMSGKTGFLTVITIFFTLILFVIIYKIERVLIQTNHKKHLFSFIQFILVLLTAGAFGNLIDRVRLEYVVDFIQFEFIEFPIFNVADCYVTVSALVLITVLMFFLKEEDLKEIKG